LTGSTVTFNWTAIAGADQYILTAGSRPGLSTYCSVTTAATSAICNGLPTNGSTVHVSLTTHFPSTGNQIPVPQTYPAASATLAQLTLPAPPLLPKLKAVGLTL
jgi:hypothetical protein